MIITGRKFVRQKVDIKEKYKSLFTLEYTIYQKFNLIKYYHECQINFINNYEERIRNEEEFKNLFKEVINYEVANNENKKKLFNDILLIKKYKLKYLELNLESYINSILDYLYEFKITEEVNFKNIVVLKTYDKYVIALDLETGAIITIATLSKKVLSLEREKVIKIKLKKYLIEGKPNIFIHEGQDFIYIGETNLNKLASKKSDFISKTGDNSVYYSQKCLTSFQDIFEKNIFCNNSYKRYVLINFKNSKIRKKGGNIN